MPQSNHVIIQKVRPMTCCSCGEPIIDFAPVVHEPTGSCHVRCWEVKEGKDRLPGYVSGDPAFWPKTYLDELSSATKEDV